MERKKIDTLYKLQQASYNIINTKTNLIDKDRVINKHNNEVFDNNYKYCINSKIEKNKIKTIKSNNYKGSIFLNRRNKTSHSNENTFETYNTKILPKMLKS